MIYAKTLVEGLAERGQWIATAESCSGGLLAAAITDIPGSSEVFGYGLVTYSNVAKMRLLGVDEQTLLEHGAVSEQTARAMVNGLLRLSGADIALATTGIAGPGGGSTEKPVGLVYIGCANADSCQVQRCQFNGDRAAVRAQTVETALQLAVRMMGLPH